MIIQFSASRPVAGGGGGGPAVPRRRRRGADGGHGGAAEPRGSAPPPRLRQVPRRRPPRGRLPHRRRLHAPPHPRLALLPLLAMPTSSGDADGARRCGWSPNPRRGRRQDMDPSLCRHEVRRCSSSSSRPSSFFTHLTVLPSLFPDPVKEPPRARFEKVD